MQRALGFAAAILLVVLAAAPAAADDPPRLKVVVPEFGTTEKIRKAEPELPQNLAKLAGAALAPRYEVLSAKMLASAMEKAEVETADLHEDAAVALRVGRALDARFVLLGDAASFGESIGVTVRLLDVERGRITASAMQVADGLEDVPGKIPALLGKVGLLEKREKPVKGPGFAKAPAPPPAKKGLPALLLDLGSPDAGVRFAAAVELGRLGDKAAVASLVGLLEKDGDVFVRRAAARSLGELDAWTAVPALIDGLGDKEYFVAMTCEKALTAITGEEFGLTDGLTKPQVEKVVAAARRWWTAHANERKE